MNISQKLKVNLTSSVSTFLVTSAEAKSALEVASNVTTRDVYKVSMSGAQLVKGSSVIMTPWSYKKKLLRAMNALSFATST